MSLSGENGPEPAQVEERAVDRAPLGPLVDAHAHLADAVFDADRDEVLARARAAGVARVVTVGETLDDARAVLALAEREPMIAPCAGLYPTVLDPEQLDAIEAFITRHRDRLVAIGEVGLDRWKVQDEAGRRLQERLFLRQVELAIRLDLPLNVHSRSAGRRAIEALIEAGARRVLLHAFDGKPGSARAGIEAGFFFSVPPSIARSPQKQRLARALPLESILLETDSPVLGATPGERNEPAAVRTSLAHVARLKGIDEAELAAITTANARRLFGDLI